MLAAKTTVPILGVTDGTRYLKAVESLYSILQMPKGIPVATFAIGEAGAATAALFASSMLANNDTELAKKLAQFRDEQRQVAMNMALPPE
jgi:5-(carboxyamino)imidazole ribonucleotide mutase